MRVYSLPGNKKHPSVTTILSHGKKENFGLRKWKSNNYNWRDILDYTAVRGTMIHNGSAHKLETLGARSNAALEVISSKRMMQVSKKMNKSITDLYNDVQMGMMFFDQFLAENEVDPLMSEVVVWSNKHKFAGQVDQVMWLNGELTIVDIKTAKAVYKDSGYDKQLSAYAVALAERTGNPKYLSCKRAVLLLSPDVEITNRMTYKLVYQPDNWIGFKKHLDDFYKAKIDTSNASIRDFSKHPENL